jgi:hypothetical protein
VSLSRMPKPGGTTGQVPQKIARTFPEARPCKARLLRGQHRKLQAFGA